MVVLSAVFLLGTVGNGLVIYFAAFRMKRTVNIVWYLNLAIADFVYSSFQPLSIVYLAHAHWPFGTFMCKVDSIFRNMNLFASIFLLTVISLDRCVSVLFPVWCRNHRTPKLASFVALGVWLIAFVFSLPYLMFSEIGENKKGNMYCYNNYGNGTSVKQLNHTGTVVMKFIFGFAIPFILIISCYSIILLRIRRNHMTTSSKPFKVAKAVIISFFVCWFPFHVFSFVDLATSYSDDFHLLCATVIGGSLSYSLMFLNSCVNPFLYFFLGQDFKVQFRTSFQAIFEKVFTEESVQLDSHSNTRSTSESHIVLAKFPVQGC
ncbi:formyl peptide receptor 2-like [Hyperolius riggenbachi]|uniref:formyl peptide receptor 2-like n=1 Tax=Hyperolius riggenbachi TaxID=752182 RepID=UPI0035A385B9